MKKIKNSKAIGKDDVRDEMIKIRGSLVIEWIRKLCNMTFESYVVPEDWSTAVNAPCIKVKSR